MKQTPFHDVGLELGARMVELFGYYLPWEYDPGHSEEHTALALQGPRSADVLGKLTKADLSVIRYYHFESAQVANVECLLARMGYTGEFGFELHFPPAEGRHIWAEIMSAGAEVGVVPLGQAALESLRQEAGYLLVGNDHDK